MHRSSDTHHIAPRSILDDLEERLRRTPPRRKGDRTRERMRLAAGRALEVAGFRALRIIDITNAARTSSGAFYAYFSDRNEAVMAVLAPAAEAIYGAAPTPGDTLAQAIGRWLLACRANRLLMRSFGHAAEEIPAFAALLDDRRASWVDALSRTSRDLGHCGIAPAPERPGARTALASLVDGLALRAARDADDELGIEVLASVAADLCAFCMGTLATRSALAAAA